MIYAPLVARIVAEESGKKDPLKAAKTRLHQMFGAYVQGNAHKKAAQLLKNEKEILNLHASTKERLPFAKEFYEFIAAQICACEIKTILDLGCGFNPFAIPIMPRVLTQNLEAYHAYDIDLRTKEILNNFFALHGLPPLAKCADLAAETPRETADIAFMFKLLPVLEAQRASRGFELANSLNANFLVISYPLKSLGGREKGMEKNYSAAFENAIANGLLNNFLTIASKRIGNELVYVNKYAGEAPTDAPVCA
jgi:16S rRNA (guanine(1405)-N(7))-methyltransferase